MTKKTKSPSARGTRKVRTGLRAGLRYEMENVRVTSYSFSGAGG